MGMFCVTSLSTNHDISNFPVTKITGSSMEYLFTSKRGKFSTAVTIEKGTVITETIKSMLLMGGEKLSRICISPYLSDENFTTEMNAKVYESESNDNK